MHFHFLVAFCLLTTFNVAHADAIPTPNPELVVNLRIEGENTTIFEGPIFTRGHNVTTASGGNHHCDGTNNGINAFPGATCTSALDDAARSHGFSFDGTFDAEFDDFFITSIGGETQTATQFWGILLNFQFTPVGGCQQEVKIADNVLFAFDAFSKVHFLKLAGQEIAHVNQPVVLTVTDGLSGSPVSGADVNGQTSDANGQVSVTFGQIGTHGVKAEKSDSIRSNKLSVLVVI
ncbi:hypothetical protein BU17DRAFT_47263 [Hysterangium stoloniferum]|nr:hypothetical protein BU17DRAFT_47263 [Hysterangium stoloniferum]